MNRKLICEALNLIDDIYIEEYIIRQNEKTTTNYDSNRTCKFSRKWLLFMGISLCIILSSIAILISLYFWN